jgi:ECF sigma factor
MVLPPQGSVTGWLHELKVGPETAAQQLWNRYFAQLVTLARHRLRGLARDVDEEDVALSALKSAMLGVQNNCFPDLNDRTGLWPLLVTVTNGSVFGTSSGMQHTITLNCAYVAWRDTDLFSV